MVRKATLLACGGILVASAAMAAVPSPAPDSVLPCGINLVGTTGLGGTADAKGQFTIQVNDLALNPIAGSSVVISFNTCTPDIRVCTTQSYPVSGIVSDCSGVVGSVSAVTDGNGEVILRVTGGSNNIAAGTPGAGFKCAVVFADGVALGTVNVGAYDETGGGGVGVPDVSSFLSDSFRFQSLAIYVGRSDFNCNNTITPTDLANLLTVSLPGTSSHSCGAALPIYCH
jgi:hypothetical protein